MKNKNKSHERPRKPWRAKAWRNRVKQCVSRFWQYGTQCQLKQGTRRNTSSQQQSEISCTGGAGGGYRMHCFSSHGLCGPLGEISLTLLSTRSSSWVSPWMAELCFWFYPRCRLCPLLNSELFGLYCWKPGRQMTIAYELHLKGALSERAQVSGGRKRKKDLSIQLKCELGKRVGNPSNSVHTSRERRLEVWIVRFLSAELNWYVTCTISHGLCPWRKIIDGLGFLGFRIHVDLRLLSCLKQQPERENNTNRKCLMPASLEQRGENRLTLSVTRRVSDDLLQYLEWVGSVDGGRLLPGIFA